MEAKNDFWLNDCYLLYSLQTRKFTCSANLIPALVLQPAGVRVRSGVLQAHSSSQQEHEVSVFNLIFCSEWEKKKVLPCKTHNK